MFFGHTFRITHCLHCAAIRVNASSKLFIQTTQSLKGFLVLNIPQKPKPQFLLKAIALSSVQTS